MRRQTALTGLLVALAGSAAAAQDQIVASLPFLGGQTAGPNGTDYPPPNDARDLWIIEDFGISTDTALGRFETVGTVFPSPMSVTDVNVRIYDAMPPDGNLIMTSTPGHGTVNAAGVFSTDFGGQLLPAGSYFIVWDASTVGTQIVVIWAQGGAHAVGGGLPDNAWLWNPNGGWGYPNNLKMVPQDLNGNGQTGANFKLWGSPMSCYANCDASTGTPILTANDFACFLTKYAAGTLYTNCDHSTSAPLLNVNDFQCFLNAFAAGCS